MKSTSSKRAPRCGRSSRTSRARSKPKGALETPPEPEARDECCGNTPSASSSEEASVSDTKVASRDAEKSAPGPRDSRSGKDDSIILDPSSKKDSVLDTVLASLPTTSYNRTPEVDYEESDDQKKTPPFEIEEKRPPVSQSQREQLAAHLGSDSDPGGVSPIAIPRKSGNSIPDELPSKFKRRKPFPEDTSLLNLRGNDTIEGVIKIYHELNALRGRQYGAMTPCGRTNSWLSWCKLYNDNCVDAAFKQASIKRDKKNSYLERVSNAKSVQSVRSRTLRERVESSGYLPVGRKASSYFDSKADRAPNSPDREYVHRSKKFKVSLETGRVPARRPSQGLEHPSSGKFAAPRSTGSRGNLATSLGSLSPLSCGDGGGFSPPATFPTLANRARVAAPSMGEEAATSA